MIKTDLTGRVAVVTGAGSEPARTICEMLAKNGARVIACDKDIEQALSTAAELEKTGLEHRTQIAVRYLKGD